METVEQCAGCCKYEDVREAAALHCTLEAVAPQQTAWEVVWLFALLYSHFIAVIILEACAKRKAYGLQRVQAGKCVVQEWSLNWRPDANNLQASEGPQTTDARLQWQLPGVSSCHSCQHYRGPCFTLNSKYAAKEQESCCTKALTSMVCAHASIPPRFVKTRRCCSWVAVVFSSAYLTMRVFWSRTCMAHM